MMNKKLLPVLSLSLLLFAGTNLFAQQDNTKTAKVHLSLWDPIGTNGREAKEYTNTFSFNVLFGRSAAEQTFTLSGLGSLIGENASGLQIAGLANMIGANSSGIQIAGLANTIGANTSGLQIAGLANTIGANSSGIQIAGLANTIGANSSGIQIAGLANTIGANTSGTHIAGLANTIGANTSGIHIAGLANTIGANASGIQIAGIMNKASNVGGMQIAGIFNKAKNIKGLQLGVVNIAESGDYPIGLVNLIQNGEKGIALTFDELQNLTATFRSGSRILYGIVGLGYHFQSSKQLAVFESGLGAKIQCTPRFRINAETTQTLMTRLKGVITRNSVRILPAYKLTSNIAVFAGPTFNYMYIYDSNQHTLFPKHTVYSSSSGNNRFYFGYMGGLYFIF